MQEEKQLQNMVAIPSGIFLRGSTESPDEEPMKYITISSFAIDTTPVTNHMFRNFIEAKGYQKSIYWTVEGWEFIQQIGASYPNYWYDDHWNQDNHPVTGVSWWEAMAYAHFVGKTLPTEAQWEYACKGPGNRKYPWGDEEPTEEYANFAPNCDPVELQRSSTSVYAHPNNISVFGCIDMAGNLAEWCLDNWSPNYLYDETNVDPLFETHEKDYHVARGGCGLHNEIFLRCSSRDSYPPTVRDNLIGFRCVSNNILIQKGEKL